MLRQTAIMLMAFATGSAVLAQDQPVTAPQIMILGTYHFTGGGSDYISSPVADHLAPERQAEIAILLDRLEAFAPTRIVVELGPGREAAFNADYARYRTGERALTVNERQQIGMALAARLGHERLYAADFQTDMDFEGMLSAARASAQTDLLAEFERRLGHRQERAISPDEIGLPVLERLIQMNRPEAVAEHNVYLLLAQMGAADNPAGAEQMQIWWGRNLHILANIARISESGDRVLVIYSAGHKYLLDQFIDSAPNLDRIDPLIYLQ